VQGSAADLIKLAMISVQLFIDSSKLKSLLIMQVHDELVLEVPQDEVEMIRSNITRLMQSVARLDVPLIVEVGIGENWDKAH